MQEIRTWFSHKDYIEGIRLYLHYGQDPSLKRLLTEEQQTPYKAQRLEKALREVLQGFEVVKEEAPKATAQLTATSWPMEAARDDVLKALRSEWLQHFKTMQDLRSQLLHFPTDEQRGEAAFEILRLDELCDEIYAQRDYYNQHGHLPKKKTNESETIIDPVKIVQRMETLKRYIRREDQNLLKNPGNSGAADRKIKWINEYNRYAKKSGNDLI